MSPSPPPTCRGEPGARAEVDGDPRPDVALLAADAKGDMVLTVCTGAGGHATLPVAGMGEVFEIVDVDGDGRDELFAGGTTVFGGGADVVRYAGGRLRFVRTADGEVLTVRFGVEPDDRGIAAEEAWGCRSGRLVQVRVDWRRGTVRTETYALRGTRAVRTEATTRPAPSDGPRDGSYAAGLAGVCPHRREPG